MCFRKSDAALTTAGCPSGRPAVDSSKTTYSSTISASRCFKQNASLVAWLAKHEKMMAARAQPQRSHALNELSARRSSLPFTSPRRLLKSELSHGRKQTRNDSIKDRMTEMASDMLPLVLAILISEVKRSFSVVVCLKASERSPSISSGTPAVIASTASPSRLTASLGSKRLPSIVLSLAEAKRKMVLATLTVRSNTLFKAAGIELA
ncbi:hypothetical protein Pla108_41980 [Botrimarina colliarenosi]|uniref:Uncharacterized protein n=1 Tax=Botrimarina colliarenosi TaxID=2528001 RepID=A0A5C5ZXR3_9BACT|nr:hypothetical protein Pla108_41980 [Botrimarina colliarenosi]